MNAASSSHSYLQDELRASWRFLWLAIFALAFVLRVFELGNQNLWYDEQLTVSVSQAEGKDFLKALEIESNKPPLYFLVMHYWLKWSATEFWIRLPSAICGALTCLVMLALGREFFGKDGGWIAGVLLALLPFHIYYSQEARMFALLALTGSGAMLSTWRFCGTRQWRYAVLYVVCATLSCYTFTYGVFLMPFSCLLGLFFRPRLPLRDLLILWGVNILAALLFLPWVPRLLQSMQSGTGLQTTSRGPAVLALGYAFFTLGLGTTFGPTTEQLRILGRHILSERPVAVGLLAGGLMLVALVLALGLKLLWQRNRNGFFFAAIGLGIFWGCPAALNMWKPGIPYNPRYAIMALIPFTMAVAGFFVWALEKKVWPKALALLFAGCVGISLTNLYFNPAYARDDLRSAARFIKSLAPAPNNLIVCAGFMQSSFAYYYEGPIRLLPLKVSGAPVEEALQPIQKELAEGQTFGLIYTRPDHGDPRGILPGWLKQHYHLELEKSWTGVTFYLFRADAKQTSINQETTSAAAEVSPTAAQVSK